MREFIFEGESLPEAYHKSLAGLHLYGEQTPVPNYNTEQIEISATLVVHNPFLEPMISGLTICDPYQLEKYRQEILFGILDFEIGQGWHYTYHDRMKDQLPFAANELGKNPYSRQAVIDLRTPDDIGDRNPACLQHIQLFIRNDKLHMKVLFRSNDAYNAAFINAFGLIMLQRGLSKQLGVSVGTYTHRANSYHAYKKDWATLDSAANKIWANKAPTFNYVGDWEDQMVEERINVDIFVENRRNRKS